MASRLALRWAQMQHPSPVRTKAAVPILLITDIGRDIDDTLALLTLAGLEVRGYAKLVGVVTSGGATRKRASVVRWWLRRLGIRDEDVPVAAASEEAAETAEVGRTECFVPEGTPPVQEAGIESTCGSELILRLTRQYRGQLEIVAIAPLNPLAKAIGLPGGLDTIAQGVRRLHIQGQASFEDGCLVPHFEAFNLSEDREAAITVFEKLQNRVPFHLLGKYAAYRVSLMREDFTSWDELLGGGGGDEMIEAAKNNMNIFRNCNPNLFYELYPVTEEKRLDDEWFSYMTVLSHPYDPLTILSAFQPKLFSFQEWQRIDDEKRDGDEERRWCHVLCGNEAAFDGVPDALVVRTALTELIGLGVRRLVSAELSHCERVAGEPKEIIT